MRGRGSMHLVSVLKNLNYMYIFLMYVYSQQFLHDFAKTCCESCADQVGVGGSGPPHPAEIQLQLKLYIKLTRNRHLAPSSGNVRSPVNFSKYWYYYINMIDGYNVFFLKIFFLSPLHPTALVIFKKSLQQSQLKR